MGSPDVLDAIGAVASMFESPWWFDCSFTYSKQIEKNHRSPTECKVSC
jgi:hypothetical protein